MFQVEASHNNKIYVLVVDKSHIQLNRKKLFSSNIEIVFDLKDFAINASFNDIDLKIEYHGYILKIHNVEDYTRLKNTVNEILKKEEEERKLKNEIELLTSKVKTLLLEVFTSRLWYVAYLNNIDKSGYVDAIYNLPEYISQTKDPIEAYENLKSKLLGKLDELSQALNLIDPSRREKLLHMIQETVAKHDELIKDVDYEKIPEVLNSTKPSIESTIGELVKEISSLIGQRNAGEIAGRRTAEETPELACCPYCGSTNITKTSSGSIVCERCGRKLR
jgi:hypothetical protein